ncbi:sulfite exporter TauE/SafE family protein [Amycolatopsis sp.]|uniref:sulfite exporter TauE/SafE family protein n=1 Tax=Amycolatopsis sp. TaxID=37632 RepID=UPI002C7ED62E|nr:sulfite exporter TauE/SafE family protein [Amycolatopsis sp.]HVV09496.1 sulfite exporter TauE/SafE family protein [Amycolatopsis sp.]
MTGLSVPILVLLGVIGLAGGIGITAVGPGGVLPTIGLFALTSLPPAQVAGTAIVTHIATGALGTAAYARSGQLRAPETRRTATILAGAAVVGVPVGVLTNTLVSKRAFGVVLGMFVAGAAILVWYRETRPPVGKAAHPRAAVVACLGFAIAVVAGIVGIGGPMLAVPLLVALGVPVLDSLASAQAQSIVIATAGSAAYLAAGSVDWPLAALVGIPELAGVLVGWQIARALPTRRLKHILIATLLAVAPYVAWSSSAK